jgi:hypothetical protein
MSDQILTQNVLAWTLCALALVLCLPFAGTRKLLLELTAWALRLGILAAVAGGALLWFRPDLVPAEVLRALDAMPLVRDLLPAPGAQAFGLFAAALAAAPLLPLLALIDVARKLAGRRLRRLRRLADAQPVPAVHPAAASTAPGEVGADLPVAEPVYRPGRRAAAATLAEIGSRKPFRVADHLS